MNCQHSHTILTIFIQQYVTYFDHTLLTLLRVSRKSVLLTVLKVRYLHCQHKNTTLILLIHNTSLFLRIHHLRVCRKNALLAQLRVRDLHCQCTNTALILLIQEYVTYFDNTSLKSMQKECATWRGGGLGSRPKKMYGERLGDGVEYHLMSPTPRR